jgi:hypothetical protein
MIVLTKKQTEILQTLIKLKVDSAAYADIAVELRDILNQIEENKQ